MAAALRRIGFDKVFDTNFSADLTIGSGQNYFLTCIYEHQGIARHIKHEHKDMLYETAVKNLI